VPDGRATTAADEAALHAVVADLHVHTALSPCGADEMTPPAIVAAAVERGLDMIAVCDHNCTRNAAAVQQAAGDRLAVLAGMEITTAEEAHVVGLFPSIEAARAAGEAVCASLPAAQDGYTSFFGEQWVLSAEGELVDNERHALALATDLDLSAVVRLIHEHGGLAVAAHVDRRTFGVIAQLGFFPTDAGFDAIEVSRFLADDSPRLAELAGYGLPITSSSDSHYLADLGADTTLLTVAAPTFNETAMALRGEAGRSATRGPRLVETAFVSGAPAGGTASGTSAGGGARA
jgi:PHP family Zn ribbon phosphoesterase